ncbi:Grx4 family monothiol glutaredoxin [Granulosicoccus antarcticus]|uniref:Glutaredoxin n=1 Tax=Granulosicoccus antarcticus IMCC3135 TaxID=1192854 RepID=A0A2Z2NYL8_9GAMM|nr:Grx4 family monothiol glutaredoxin [Granulosicoccus antarcticus]ASJ76419.1 Glutaredoxin-4 [Granulosicoccus antarcticus IMCC3135]
MSDQASDVRTRIEQQISENSIILYMKGTPQLPMCGFSMRTVEALKQCEQEFAFVNIIADPAIRETLPQVSDWPTFPQLYIEGELVGGCDIVMELAESGDLKKMIDKAAAQSA